MPDELEHGDDNTQDLSAQETPAPSSQPPTSPSPNDGNWETRYKGLQTVLSNRTNELNNTKQKLDEFATKLETMESQATTTEQEREKLSADLESLKKKLNEAEEAKKKSERHLKVAQTSPELLAFLSYLPDLDADEDYLAEATKLNTLIDKAVEERLKGKLSGTTPALPDGSAKLGQADLDKLWEKAVSVAGVPGKEAEYEKAYQEWVAASTK